LPPSIEIFFVASSFEKLLYRHFVLSFFSGFELFTMK
jgi:hypothetical protein